MLGHLPTKASRILQGVCLGVKDKIANLKKFEYPWPSKTMVPNDDFVWKDFVRIREWLWELKPLLEEMEKTIEKQDIEIDKLKRQGSNKVQKIEIVRFLGEETVPKKQEIMKNVKWPKEQA